MTRIRSLRRYVARNAILSGVFCPIIFILAGAFCALMDLGLNGLQEKAVSRTRLFLCLSVDGMAILAGVLLAVAVVYIGVNISEVKGTLSDNPLFWLLALFYGSFAALTGIVMFITGRPPR